MELALQRGWPIAAAANLSRTEARAIVADPARSGLPPAAPPLRAALERDMIEGHCGNAPEPSASPAWSRPRDYADGFDYFWFTPRAPRADPCAK